MAKKKKNQKGDWSDDEPTDPNTVVEEEDLGGLMATLNKAKGKKSKGKKKNYDDDDDAAAILARLDAEVLTEKSNNEPEIPQKLAKESPAISSEPPEEIRIKSKKEKEKERKERQKLLKKQQQQEQELPSEPIKTEVKSPNEPKSTTTTTAPKKKKAGPPVAALKQLVEAQRAAEEERRRLEEEERLRIEEEERKIAEEERIKEEQRLAKKEKERLKKEELKKAGKYLTPAQKKAQQMAKAKLQALLESGQVKVEALEKKDDEEKKPKRVVYGNKKKNNKKNEPLKEEKVEPKEEVKESWDQDSDHEQPKESLDNEVEDMEDLKESWDQESNQDVKDSWDQESDQDVKDSWDQESEPELKPIPKKVQIKVEAPKAKEVAKPKLVEEEVPKASKAVEKKNSSKTVAKKEPIKNDLRSPICCILGHVDTGKTKLLDKIRQTNVQEGEAGGITQQIGATYFPMDVIEQKTSLLRDEFNIEYNVPGLLVIDTPGHESFTNLRSRGSSLCNIAILVVDIMHGLEPQTIESIGLLRQRKTPFVVALNKIDRIYGWKATPHNPSIHSLKDQPDYVVKEFNDRLQNIVVQFAEQGLNACLYYDNKNYARNVSLVPTSAITGEGIPDLLYLLIHLTQSRMSENLKYLSSVECTVLEVKVIEGLGTTIDVVLSNGVLNEGDRIVLCGMNGPIATNIRALLTPQPLRELRVKSAYVKHKQVKAALGVKISAPDLEKAIAGSQLMVVGPEDDEEELMEDIMSDLTSLLDSVDKSGKGVCVQSSTLGSLEALLVFLKSSNIPVAGINIGPVHKKDIIRASIMLERAPEYAQMLAFDVTVDKDAELLADELNVKIFRADIIYHLFDSYTAYMAEVLEQKRKDQAPQAVFPCVIRIVPGAVFNKRSPLVMGVDVVEGCLRIGTPICVVNQEKKVVKLGKVTSIELNHKAKEVAKKGDPSVAIKLEIASYETPRMYGRHFEQDMSLYSQISRESIDILKESFRSDMTNDDWALIIRLKKIFGIA